MDGSMGILPSIISTVIMELQSSRVGLFETNFENTLIQIVSWYKCAKGSTLYWPPAHCQQMVKHRKHLPIIQVNYLRWFSLLSVSSRFLSRKHSKTGESFSKGLSQINPIGTMQNWIRQKELEMLSLRLLIPFLPAGKLLCFLTGLHLMLPERIEKDFCFIFLFTTEELIAFHLPSFFDTDKEQSFFAIYIRIGNILYAEFITNIKSYINSQFKDLNFTELVLQVGDG